MRNLNVYFNYRTTLGLYGLNNIKIKEMITGDKPFALVDLACWIIIKVEYLFKCKARF